MTTGRRVHERYDQSLKVSLRTEETVIECVTKNISLGGMYLVTDNELPYGTPVQLEVYLPALREDVSIAATVRWNKPDGIGVQFGSLRAREVWAFNQLFREGD